MSRHSARTSASKRGHLAARYEALVARYEALVARYEACVHLSATRGAFPKSKSEVSSGQISHGPINRTDKLALEINIGTLLGRVRNELPYPFGTVRYAGCWVNSLKNKGEGASENYVRHQDVIQENTSSHNPSGSYSKSWFSGARSSERGGARGGGRARRPRLSRIARTTLGSSRVAIQSREVIHPVPLAMKWCQAGGESSDRLSASCSAGETCSMEFA